MTEVEDNDENEEVDYARIDAENVAKLDQDWEEAVEWFNDEGHETLDTLFEYDNGDHNPHCLAAWVEENEAIWPLFCNLMGLALRETMHRSYQRMLSQEEEDNDNSTSSAK